VINTQNQKIVLLTPPAAIVDNAAVVTGELDTFGFDYADIYVVLGATDVAVATLKLQESDVSGSGFVDVDGGNFATAATLPSATQDNTVHAFHVNLLGRKRFLDVALAGGDGATGAYFTVFAVLSRPREAPNSAAERGLAQELFV
jgi:hypothetical protein